MHSDLPVANHLDEKLNKSAWPVTVPFWQPDCCEKRRQPKKLRCFLVTEPSVASLQTPFLFPSFFAEISANPLVFQKTSDPQAVKQLIEALY
jgi:hypothetical protein